MKIPCKECLKLPVCRHKELPELFHDCDDVLDYISERVDKNHEPARNMHKMETRLDRLSKYMKPSTKW